MTEPGKEKGNNDSIFPHPHTMSVEEYLEFDRSNIEAKYEYIDGCVTRLAGGTINHATISFNVARTLHNLLRGRPCLVLTSNARVKLSEARYVYPDVSVSCNPQDRGENDIVQSPCLIVEVLSPGTEAYDRGRKFTYYRNCPTIQEYILVSAHYQSVEVFRRERNNLWTLQIFGANEEVELARLGVRFRVADIYEDVLFIESENDPPPTA